MWSTVGSVPLVANLWLGLARGAGSQAVCVFHAPRVIAPRCSFTG